MKRIFFPNITMIAAVAAVMVLALPIGVLAQPTVSADGTASGDSTGAVVRSEGEAEGEAVEGEDTQIDLGTAKSRYFKVQLEKKKYVYTAKVIKPAITKITYRGISLVEGVDYSVAYANNILTGRGEVIISGLGNYKGSKAVYFTITPKKLTEDDVTVTVADQVYCGVCEPTPYVKFKETNKGFPLADYVVKYKNNKKVTDNAVVIIKGVNNYKGSITKKFKITQLKLDEYDLRIPKHRYRGAPIKPLVSATRKDDPSEEIIIRPSAFSGTYSNNTEVGDKTAHVVYKPKKNKYIDWGERSEISLDFSICPCDMGSDIKISRILDQKYRGGKEVRPKVTVFVDRAVLKPSNYEIEYRQNKERGTAEIIIWPKGKADNEHFYNYYPDTFRIK